jgi:hypothetical protein
LKADDTRQPYVYLPYKGGPKRGSQKIDHFLAIANVYLKLRETGKLRRFDIEPKLGDKGIVEPDIFTIWNKWPLFIEVQRSNYSDTIMKRKLKRYEAYFRSMEWVNLDWQPKGRKPFFPNLWIISNRNYDVSWLSGIRVRQAKTLEELL